MYIAACRITFSLPGNRSLKGKRQVVRRVTDRIRHKFHASAAEVGDTEQWSQAEIGFAVLSSNEPHARTMAENILTFLDSMMIAPILDIELELVPFDDLAEGNTFGEIENWKNRGFEKLGE